MFFLEPFPEKQQIVLTFFVGLKVQAVALYLLISDNIVVEFVFSIVNGPICLGRELEFLPV